MAADLLELAVENQNTNQYEKTIIEASSLNDTLKRILTDDEMLLCKRYFVDEMTQTEIASEFGKEQSTINGWLDKLKDKVRKELAR